MFNFLHLPLKSRKETEEESAAGEKMRGEVDIKLRGFIAKSLADFSLPPVGMAVR